MHYILQEFGWLTVNFNIEFAVVWQTKISFIKINFKLKPLKATRKIIKNLTTIFERSNEQKYESHKIDLQCELTLYIY